MSERIATVVDFGIGSVSTITPPYPSHGDSPWKIVEVHKVAEREYLVIWEKIKEDS